VSGKVKTERPAAGTSPAPLLSCSSDPVAPLAKHGIGDIFDPLGFETAGGLDRGRLVAEEGCAMLGMFDPITRRRWPLAAPGELRAEDEDEEEEGDSGGDDLDEDLEEIDEPIEPIEQVDDFDEDDFDDDFDDDFEEEFDEDDDFGSAGDDEIEDADFE
jgi:hypothetical protein